MVYIICNNLYIDVFIKIYSFFRILTLRNVTSRGLGLRFFFVIFQFLKFHVLASLFIYQIEAFYT